MLYITNRMNNWTEWMNQNPELTLFLALWSLAWKGYALWKAAEREHKYWFIAIFLLSTFGILEMIYLFFIARKYKVEVVDGE